MSTYTFQLRDGSSGVEDLVGVDLPDRERAFAYAYKVARELMSFREPQTRAWRLDVYENKGECVLQIPFASIDETLGHLTPELRAAVEDLHDRCRSLNEAMSAASITVRESRALIALSRGKPYLAAERGQTTIRDY